MTQRLSSWFLVMVIVGCAMGRDDVSLLNPKVSYPAKDPSHLVWITTERVEAPFDEIGFIRVSATNREGYGKLNDKLRKKAREIGADGVMSVAYGIENVFSVSPFFFSIPYYVITAQGIAIRREVQ